MLLGHHLFAKWEIFIEKNESAPTSVVNVLFFYSCLLSFIYVSVCRILSKTKFPRALHTSRETAAPFCKGAGFRLSRSVLSIVARKNAPLEGPFDDCLPAFSAFSTCPAISRIVFVFAAPVRLFAGRRVRRARRRARLMSVEREGGEPLFEERIIRAARKIAGEWSEIRRMKIYFQRNWNPSAEDCVFQITLPV